MLSNYLKIAFRNLKKNKGFSFIQIVGLAIGISLTLVIGLLVRHEYSYDTFHKDGDRIYRIVTISKFGSEEFPNSGVPMPLAEAVKNDISGVENVAPFYIWKNIKVAFPGKTSSNTVKNVNDIIFTNKEYFQVFSYQWLAGSPEISLNEPYKVVLTESKAREYFNYNDATEAIGKTITYRDSIHTTVSGIIKDFQGLTDFKFRDFISYATINKTNLQKEFYLESWNSINSYSQLFVKVEKGVEENKIEAQFPALLKKYTPENSTASHELQQLSNIHFNDRYDAFERRTAHKPTLYGLLLLSFFILLLACINYINLTTAQSSIRKKEISVRKTFGGSKKQLIYQFLGESIVKVLLAAIISVLFLPLLFKYFSDFLPQELINYQYINLPNLLILLLFVLILGCVAGVYPAFVLAAFRPVWLLKGTSSTTRSGQFFRKSLIVFQFAIAFCLIIGSFTVSRQINYGLTKELGYKKDAIVNVSLPWKSNQSEKEHFYRKLQAIPEYNLISLGGEPPASHGTISIDVEFSEMKDMETTLPEFKFADPEYIDIYGLKIISGKNLSASDTSRELLINETLAKKLGYENPDEIIGKSLKINASEKPIVGVIADFHSKSMHQPVKPLVITSDKQYFNVAHITLPADSEKWPELIKKAEAAWQDVFPEEAFNYQFFDQKIASFYDREVKLNKLLNWATGIAIFISCLGLIGMISFIIQQKTKEIGIRKVLGASVSAIVLLLSNSFIKLILIAFAIATPIGYYFINDWLQGFTYKIDIQWWLFVVPGMAILFIAFFVVSIQSMKAALTNPVNSLRSE